MENLSRSYGKAAFYDPETGNITKQFIINVSFSSNKKKRLKNNHDHEAKKTKRISKGMLLPSVCVKCNEFSRSVTNSSTIWPCFFTYSTIRLFCGKHNIQS